MAAATKKEGTIAEKLDALFELQKIDSEIDRIRTIRGELPLEVQSLEDEIIGLNTRVSKINDEIKEVELADIALMAAAEVRRFGVPPKVAFLSHSSFGSSKRASAKKMRLARDLFVARHPEIECDGELHGDAALEPNIRATYMQDSTLTGSANLLICPNLDSANILYNVLKTTTSGGVTVGPVLMGAAATAYILTPAATVRRVLNMTALAAASNA